MEFTKNEKLVILARFIDVLITSSIYEEVWYITDDKFMPTYKELWDPYTNFKQAELIFNKIESNPLTKQYERFLLNDHLVFKKEVTLEERMNFCVKIIGYVKQLQ
jgi:hypothetical protein